MLSINESLRELMSLRGALAACAVDYLSRITLGASRSAYGPDLTKAANGGTDMVRVKLATLEELGYAPERLEDIVITLDNEYHVIHPLSGRRGPGVFLYLALDRRCADLTAARTKLRKLAPRLEV